jgi:hypothetical protein
VSVKKNVVALEISMSNMFLLVKIFENPNELGEVTTRVCIGDSTVGVDVVPKAPVADELHD